MNEQEIEQDQVAVSEQPEVESQEEHQEQKMVPLAALQAERRKRQDLEARAHVYQEMMRAKEKAEPEVEEDPNAIVERKDLQAQTAHTKRDILETLYQDMNPEAVLTINRY